MIKVGDIFLANKPDFEGKIRKHFYYCVYSQREDGNNILKEDIIGLLITTNKKMEAFLDDFNDYNVKISLHSKDAYVLCDKAFRFREEDVEHIGDILSIEEKEGIKKYYTKFLKEVVKQLRQGEEECQK